MQAFLFQRMHVNCCHLQDNSGTKFMQMLEEALAEKCGFRFLAASGSESTRAQTCAQLRSSADQM